MNDEIRNPKVSGAPGLASGVAGSSWLRTAAFDIRHSGFFRHSTFVIRHSPFSRRAFTLVELLVVISVILLLAGLTIPIIGKIKQNAIRARTRGELTALATIIEEYKLKTGFYPPADASQPALNPLFYELLGTKVTGTTCSTLDGSAQIQQNAIQTTFWPLSPPGVGFANCSRGGGGDEGQNAKQFISNLKPAHYMAINKAYYVPQAGSAPSVNCSVLGTVSEGPIMHAYVDPSGGVTKINPWRYLANGTNNPGSFDLWVDVLIGGKTNRVSNWSAQPQVIR